MESLGGDNCPLCPTEIDVLDELFNTDHLNFRDILAADSSLECGVR